MIAEGSSSSQTPAPRDEPAVPGERDLPAGPAMLGGSGMLAGSGIRAERVSPGSVERRALHVAGSGETETETALVRRAEAAEATVKTLEGHVTSLQRRLEEAEQDGRRTSELAERLENVEGALAAIRESHRRMAATVGELKGVAMRLRTVVEAEPARDSARPRSEEMADALAAAVERLRARAEASVATQPDATSAVPPLARTPHKHSMSLIGRMRYARKHRRKGR